MIRAYITAQLKGASAWLNVLPLKEHRYTLNKREFYDDTTLMSLDTAKEEHYRGCG